jgi:signal transduction histidine kinase
METRRVGRLLKLGMVAAVAVVFAVAYLDSRREEARALADFSREQAMLARTFALTVAERAAAHGNDDAAPVALLAGVPESDAVPMGWIVMDEARRWTLHGPRELSWHDDHGHTRNLQELLADMGRGGSGARFLDRPSADALGLGPRSAVAGYAPVPGRRWSVAVVTSARRMRDRGRLAGWRLGAATAMAGLLVALFGVVIARQQRRGEELASALRLAAETAALRERSEKIVEAIPLGVLALDKLGRVTSVNAFLAQRGVTTGASLGAALTEADERAPLEALIATAMSTRTTTERRDLRVTFAGLGSERRDVDAYAVPLARPLPDVDCFLLLHDRTDVRRLERNLARAEKLATIGTLAAGVAHEVGTPLGIISGRAEQLLSRVPDGDAGEHTRKGLTSILAQVDKVSTTIRQLLDFARVRPVEASALTPQQLLASAAALLEHRFRQQRVALAVEAPPSLPAIAADPGQLEQVLVNLLINACDACAGGGHVTARATHRDDSVEVAVVDDGCGIAPEHLPSVIDPFFTTKKRGQGTGLGLTIAADIIKNHGGTLEIDSAVGKGTTVRVRLPVAAAATADAKAEAKPEAKAQAKQGAPT